MVDLTQAHKASIELLGTRHTALVEAVRNYVNGSVQPSADELIAAIEDVTTDIDTKEKMLLGLASRQAKKPVPSLILDFKTRHYLQGARRPEKGYGIHDLLSVERASPKWVYNASGKLTEVPANQPAYQHDPVTGEPLGLLIEGSRTNLALWSEDFTQPSWQRRNLSVGLSSVESPLGGQAWILTEGEGNENRQVRYFTEFVEGSTYTASCFFKAKERNFCRMQLAGAAFGLVAVVVDLSDGSLVNLIGSPLSYKIEPCVNGFYRVSVTQTAAVTDATTSRFEVVMLGPSASYTYSGDGVSSMYATGAQLEAGPAPTSYIPTTDAPATRDADDVRRELGDEFNPNGFTVYGEFHSVGNNVNGNPRIFSLEGPGTSRISLRVGTPTNRHAQLQIVNSGGAILNTTMSLPAWPGSGLVKIAYSVKNGVAIMGWDRQAETAVFEGSLPDIELFSPVFANRYFSTYTEALIIPRALTEAELIELIS